MSSSYQGDGFWRNEDLVPEMKECVRAGILLPRTYCLVCENAITLPYLLATAERPCIRLRLGKGCLNLSVGHEPTGNTMQEDCTH